jgi:A/G-specific adenine glycosylase
VLVSEVMLQQTPAVRVVPSWSRFLFRFPSAASLAESPTADVLIAWGRLGYPRRARRLHDAARMIVDRHGGEVPSTVAELEFLPGVGPYTARAVASFGFGVAVGVVDTNVGRVLARTANRRFTAREAQEVVDGLVRPGRSLVVNQALMDLGAVHCRARPRCQDCPVRRRCRWFVEGGEDPATRSAGVSRPQGTFAGSDREARGRLLAALRVKALDQSRSGAVMGVESARAESLVADLVAEHLVTCRDGRLHIGG